MFEALLVTTSSEGLKPLGTPPQRSFELITGTISQRLSQEHAQLFAEPVATSFGDQLDWYAAQSGKTKKLSELDGEEAEKAQSRLKELTEDIKELADKIGDSSDPEDQRLAEGIDNALQIPGPEFVYIVYPEDENMPLQPIFVNWARTFDQQHSVRGALTGADIRSSKRTPRPRTPPPIAEAVVTSGTSTAVHNRSTTNLLPFLWWLGWLLLALIISTILYILIPACGLYGSSFFSHCQQPTALVSTEDAETRRLQNEIIRVERQLAILDRSCQPAPPPAPEVVPEEEARAPTNEIDRRLDNAGAQQGDMNFSLAWNNTIDLDMHVKCPDGRVISYKKRKVCRGELDVDANARSRVRSPVENTFFINPISGTYQIKVNLFTRDAPRRAQPFTLRIKDGDFIKTLRGSVSPQKRNWVYNYTTGNN